MKLKKKKRSVINWKAVPNLAVVKFGWTFVAEVGLGPKPQAQSAEGETCTV